jgi:hypothetical protein
MSEVIKCNGSNEWIYPPEACKILDTDIHRFNRMRHLFTRRVLPHTRPQYLRSEVEAMASRVIVPPRQAAG